MNLTQLRNGTVLVKIASEDKRKVYEQDMEDVNGKQVSLIKMLHAGEEEDAYYSQAVYLGEVLKVADDVKHILAGDIVIIDYLADTDEDKVAYFEGDEKIVLLDADTKYHTTDRIAYASMNSRMDTYTWRKGDVESQAWIYAIFRNGELICNNDYLLLEHKELTWLGTTSTGIVSYFTEGDVAIRKVIRSPENSEFNIGDIIATEVFALLERSIDVYNFDIIMQQDVLGVINTTQ